jgi:2-octaprenyl-6-methoxyphenol hydroxylase
MLMLNHSFSILIVGAGAVGRLAAITFARAGHAVGLIAPYELPKNAGRTVALLDRSRPFLEHLGVWPSIKEKAAPLRRLRLVDATSSFFRAPELLFTAEELSRPALAWNIALRDLEAVLELALPPSVQRFSTRVVRIGIENNARTLTLETGETLSTSLVIAADGQRSAMREQAGLRAFTHSYPQTAFTCVVDHEASHNDTSTEFQRRGGVFTLVPLQNPKQSSVVALILPNTAEHWQQADLNTLNKELTEASHNLLGDLNPQLDTIGTLPMQTLVVPRLTAPHLVLIGEAAHAFPPIGAQGLNLSIRDLETLLQTYPDLPAYERVRKIDIGARTFGVHALNSTLVHDLWPLDAVRGLGLRLLENVKPLRQRVLQTVMG